MTNSPMISEVTLNTGAKMPQLGYGTFKVDPDDAYRAVTQALDTGYRHIDTAQMYRNETEVGEAIDESGVAREDIFLTTKLSNANHDPDMARRSFDESLRKLKTDYVDLFLIHWPMPGTYDGNFPETWRVMQEFYEDGRARCVGVSNFLIHHLQRLQDETGIMPAVNQVEVHPWLPNNELRAFHQEHGIITQAWSPLARGQLFSDESLQHQATRLNRTPAQLVLRWAIERGDVVFPKTISPERMVENMDLFSFELDDAARAAIDNMDRGEAGRTGSHPDEMNLIP